ncbi:hypothetical protein [Flavobacterium sp.]|uniref:hypothetical protein n=1 Tax=Flavobacterium sp. TaxID=239 RepID=UPI003264CA0F
MKKFGIVFILMLSLISCSKESNNEESKSTVVNDYYGKWTLIKMSGSFINSETTGSKMEWQENYVFNTDGTFTKTRVRNNVTTTSIGTFVITTIDDTSGFALKHKESNSIIGNCYGDLSEFLSVNEDSLLQSSWQMCDGPGLIYKKA